MWRRWLEGLAEAAWYGGAWWSVLLSPFAALVGRTVAQRRRRFLAEPPTPSALPVVVVGGITAGGTGKSPVLMALGRALIEQGLRVAVVSRGYGGTEIDNPHCIDVQQDSAATVGDEPLLIARALGVPVVVCRDRARAVQWLERQQLADLVLSDDGLQHYGMARDYEIAVLDAERGLGNGRLLPAGPLREPATRLNAVDWVLERNGHDSGRSFHYDIIGVRPLNQMEPLPVDVQRDAWQGLQLVAVTGLGQPQQFFDMLRRHGLDCRHEALADHAVISPSRLQQYKEDIILITAKDEIKLLDVDDPRVWVVDIAVQLPPELIASVMSRIAEKRG